MTPRLGVVGLEPALESQGFSKRGGLPLRNGREKLVLEGGGCKPSNELNEDRAELSVEARESSDTSDGTRDVRVDWDFCEGV